MYLTRFTKVNGQTEDHYYPTQKEARQHLERHINDTSGQYKKIAVIGDYMRVLCILPFADGKPAELLNEGSIVRLREVSESKGNNNFYAIRRIHEATGCVDITEIHPDMQPRPFEPVGVHKVQLLFQSAW